MALIFTTITKCLIEEFFSFSICSVLFSLLTEELKVIAWFSGVAISKVLFTTKSYDYTFIDGSYILYGEMLLLRVTVSASNVR